MSPEDREKILQNIRNKKTMTTNYTDVYYQTKEIKVCKVYIRDMTSPIIVPEEIGHIIDEKTALPENKSLMIPVGKIRIRAYLIEKLEFVEERFVCLENWAKRYILEKNPKLFEGQEANFSPGLKGQIEAIMKGEEQNAK